MEAEAPEHDQVASTVERSSRSTIVLLLIVLAAFALRVVQIGHPAAGYHVFNEGFYTMLSADALGKGAFAWLTQPGDLNNPPLYPLVVTTIFRLLGVSVVGARLVSAVAGAATCVYAFALGKHLFTERAGLLAAAVLAAMPGTVLITHNAQTDGLMVLLIVASTYYYVLARERERATLSLVAGLALGLALATKLPALLALAALALWETIVTPGLGWLKKRHVWVALGGFALAGLPWHLAQMVANGAAYFQAQAGVGSSFALPDGRFWSVLLFNELWWMHWPPLFLLVIAALVYAARRRTPGDVLVLAFLGVNLAFYVFFHFHTYYLLPLAPFTALAAGRLIDRLLERAPGFAWAGTGALVAGLVVAAMVMLGGHKVGPFSPAAIQPAIGQDAEGADLWVDARMVANFGDAIELYTPDMNVRPLPAGSLAPDAADLAPGVRSYLLTPAVADVGLVAEFPEERHALVLFGVAIGQRPEQDHYMANGPWEVQWRAYSPFTFGLMPMDSTPGPGVYDLEAVYGIGRSQ